MFTASNARSSHVLPSGSAPPLARFFAYRDIARSAKSSFSAYFSLGTACAATSRRFFKAARFDFFVSRVSRVSGVAENSDASNSAHPATSSAGESVTPCGHAFRRRSYHSDALMCFSPVASHAASTASSDTSNVPTAELGPAPACAREGEASPPHPPRGVAAAGAARASSSRLEMAMEVGASAAALWNERTAPSLPPHAS